MKAKAGLIIAILSLLAVFPVTASAATGAKGNQVSNCDADQNGIPDVGCAVTGQYKFTDVTSVDACDVVVQYRGEFGNTPYLDNGWITNEYRCTNTASGKTSTYTYRIVSQGQPGFTGDPAWSIWGTWQIVKYTQGGEGATGNLVRPYNGSET